jgi:hypothetical protein
MLVATCHCGAVRIEVPRRPRTLTDCNCSICRRYGALWAYYKRPDLRITHAQGATSGYSWVTGPCASSAAGAAAASPTGNRCILEDPAGWASTPATWIRAW